MIRSEDQTGLARQGERMGRVEKNGNRRSTACAVRRRWTPVFFWCVTCTKGPAQITGTCQIFSTQAIA